MEEVIETRVEFCSSEEVATLAGDQDAKTVKEQFLAFYPFLANCEYTESIEDGVKVIRFSEQFGTKGL